MYIQKAELKAEIERYHEDGKVSERLGEMLLDLARGVYLRFGYSQDDDNAIGGAVLTLMKALRKIDTVGRPFNYLTTVARNHYAMAGRHDAHHVRGLRKYREDCRFWNGV